MSKEIYISVDIETDGPIPGPHSMLQIGAAAFIPESQSLQGSAKFNLELLPGASMHHVTKTEFWDKHPGLYERTRTSLVDPAIAMDQLRYWVKSFDRKPVFVGWPVAFDFAFTHWYFMNFLGEDPFGYQGLDIRTYSMACLKEYFNHKIPPHWAAGVNNLTHDALDDAMRQGDAFMRMLRENTKV